MISAERMKSVRIAPEMVFDSASGPCSDRRHVVVVVVVAQGVDDLVGALVGEEAAAEHQDDLDDRRRDLAEQQGHRQDEQQLVAQRAEGDPLDDRAARGRRPGPGRRPA